MALIGQIRKNSWIIVVFIALGVGGFILMDIMTSGNAPGGGAGSKMIIGKVDGEKFDRNDFERTYSLLYQSAGGNPYANRAQHWNWYVENHIVSTEAERLGLAVGDQERADLEFGDNPSPIIQQRFSNPVQPGVLDRQQLDNFKNIINENRVQEMIEQGQLGPSFPDYWMHQRKEIVKDRLESKMVAMVTKAMYTPTWMAEMLYEEQNQFFSFAYVKAGFDAVANEEVTISDDDIEAYLKENKVRYERKFETRRADYISFNVQPSKEDSAAILKQMESLAAEFSTTDNDSTFVIRNEGSYAGTFVTSDALGSVADTMATIAVGSVYGPYMDGGMYKVAKLIDRRSMADSADSRHILLSATSPQDFVRAEKTADSLMNLLQAGAKFEDLVNTFSQDPGSKANGGKYEGTTPGAFVPEYDRLLFISGEIGKRYKIRTSYGFHIVEVLKRSSSTTNRYKVAFLQEAIVPSKETQNAAYDRATAFIAKYKDLETLRSGAAAEKDLSILTTGPLQQNDFMFDQLGYGNDTRDMICWLFSASKNDVSGTVYTFVDENAYYDSRYVVIGLSSIQAEGLPSVDEVRAEIEPMVLNNKKAELLAAKMTSNDLSSLASTFNTTVDTVNNTSFSMPFAEGLGNEPKVIATAYTLAAGKSSKPVQGESGVFVVQALQRAQMVPAQSLQAVQMQANGQARGQISGQLVAAMRDNIKIVDNRATFDCGASY